MDREFLLKYAPKLMEKVDEIEKEEVNELRYLLVIDENYEDIDDEELDVFDPDLYNYLVYVTPRVQEALGGAEEMEKISKELEEKNLFKNFLASEIDLYGLWCDKGEEEVAKRLLSFFEEKVKKD
ncbi:MAG: hypothetical protein GXO02_02615 [Epsilonproteobacteria bacterium]|nr:hypothetical protein [Campylobacterota bacterium]